MSVTVTVAPSEQEFAVVVTIGTSDGSQMTAVTLSRIANGVTEQTRVQPYVGLASSVVTDPEPEWDTPVVYQAVVTHGGTTETVLSAPIMVSPTDAWAVHPTKPWLSVCIDQQDPTEIGVASLGDLSRPSTASEHIPVGSDLPVYITVGPRLSSRGTMSIATVTLDDARALDALLNDQTPILIRFPSAWGMGFEDGYYQVLDQTSSRPNPYGGDPARIYALAIVRVSAPAGEQESLWDYPSLTDQMADYGTIHNSFADYPSLTAGELQA